MAFRQGRVAGVENFLIHTSLPEGEILSNVILAYYRKGRFIPGTILVQSDPFDKEALEEWLSGKRQERARILVPRKGEKKGLLDLAARNAMEAYMVHSGVGEEETALARLSRLLLLEEEPRVIHCFDVSQIQGSFVVGSRTCARNGRISKDGYRRFRIKAEDVKDDFSALMEIVERSLKRSMDENDVPDILLIDGGRPQVLAVQKAVARLDGVDAKVIGIAKKRSKAGKRERIVVPWLGNPVELEDGSPEARLLQRLRDEAHRFAVVYHRKLREKVESFLDRIPGVGPRRKKLLLNRFGSLKGIRSATLEELRSLKGIPSRVAERVWDYLRPHE